jgi:hypothetical protein
MADGTEIDGLGRMSDGRWKVSPFPGQPKAIRFVEEDERLAVARFNAMRSAAARETVNVPTRLEFQRSKNPNSSLMFFTSSTPSASFWPWLRKLIIRQPKLVALKTGIEQIAWLSDLAEPAPSPRLKEVGEEYYRRKTDLSEKESNKVEATWKDFTRATGAATLRELTPGRVAKWGAKVRAEKPAPKTIGHR